MQKYKFIGERFISSIDREINDIIEESYGVSSDVVSMVNELVEQIKDCVENGEYVETYDKFDNWFINEYTSKSKNYLISQTFVINNIVFITECILMNYSNLTDDEFDMISVLNAESQIRSLSPNRFKLICYIPSRDFRLSKKGLSVLNHEIMHSWQHYNKNINGKKEKEYPEWNQLYGLSIIDLKKNKDDILAKSIYYSDLRELAAFTQQAYYEIKDITDTNKVHNKLRTLEIYKGLNNIKSGIDYLENNDLPKKFNMITKKKLLFIFKKRYYQYKKNIARLIIAQKEIILEGTKCLDSSIIDWIFITPF